MVSLELEDAREGHIRKAMRRGGCPCHPDLSWWERALTFASPSSLNCGCQLSNTWLTHTWGMLEEVFTTGLKQPCPGYVSVTGLGLGLLTSSHWVQHWSHTIVALRHEAFGIRNLQLPQVFSYLHAYIKKCSLLLAFLSFLYLFIFKLLSKPFLPDILATRQATALSRYSDAWSSPILPQPEATCYSPLKTQLNSY